MTSVLRAIGWILIGLLGCTAVRAVPPNRLQTGYFFPSFAVSDATGEVQVSAVDLEGDPETGGAGTIVFRDCPLDCNDFGDLMPQGKERESQHRVTFEPIEVVDQEGWGRKVFSLRFAEGRFANRFYVSTSGHAALPAKLLVLAANSDPIAPQPTAGEYDRQTYAFAHVLPLQSAEPPPTEFDAPLGSFAFTTTPYWTDHLPHFNVVRISVVGEAGGEGGIALDPNRFSLEAFGEGGMGTLLGYGSQPVHCREILLADPAGGGRRVFQLHDQGWLASAGIQFTLVVGSTKLGPHRLIIRRNEELLCTLPLADRDHGRYLRLLQGLSDEHERAAVRRLQQTFTGRFSLHPEKGQLTRFDLRVRRLNPGELDPLLDLPHVSSVSLRSEDPMTAASLEVLPRLPKLASLGLHGGTVAPELLERLPKLSTLWLEGYDWSPMPRPPVPLPRRALSAIGRMEALTHLSLTALELEPESLRPLASLRSLESLSIHNTSLRLADLLELHRALPAAEFDTSSCQLTPASRTVRLMGMGVQDADVEAVVQLPWVEALHLDSCENITDAAAAHLSTAGNLVELSLIGAPSVTDQGIHGWSRLIKLRRLTLSCPQLTDRTVDELIGLENLEEVELRGDGVTPKGLELLRQELPKLKAME